MLYDYMIEQQNAHVDPQNDGICLFDTVIDCTYTSSEELGTDYNMYYGIKINSIECREVAPDAGGWYMY